MHEIPDGFLPVGRLSPGNEPVFARKVGSIPELSGTVDAAVEAVGAMHDPLHRLHDCMVDIADAIDEIMNPDADNSPKRLYGFKVGDRVGHVNDANVFGHVVHVALASEIGYCPSHCRLVHVKLFGTNKIQRFIPTELEHLD